MRTSLAAVGIRLGFNALFGIKERERLPKLIATGIVLAGVVIFKLAEHTACKVLQCPDPCPIEPLRRVNLRFVAPLMGITSSTPLWESRYTFEVGSKDLKNSFEDVCRDWPPIHKFLPMPKPI